MSAAASASAAAGAAPWKSWPHDLPSVAECRATPDFHRIHDQTRIRTMHQAIRTRTLSIAKEALKAPAHSVILLAGGTQADFDLYDTDVGKCEFRQEAFFLYLFGLNEPDCYGLLDLDTGDSVLFVPATSDDSQRWNGTRRPLSYHTERYGVTATHLTDDLISELQRRGVQQLFTLYGENTDSGSFTTTVPRAKGLEAFAQDSKALYPFLAELRVHKTPGEIEVLRLGNKISSQAHVYVMRHIREGMSELQLEALFKAWCAFHGGARHCAYTCICGSGENGSILHYGHAARPNERILADGDSCVLDMGCEFGGYATDITRSYPVNGKFTPDQAIVHNAVYEAQAAVIAAMKPGVAWADMHRLAESVILRHLLAAGVLVGESVEQLAAAHMGAVFMPHGLGHLLGLAVHDVGGKPQGCAHDSTPGVGYLRTQRALEAGMVITVEPGLYFNDPTLDKALANPAQAKHIDAQVLQRFRGTGGCRLEDDILVTADGVENLTVLPTSVKEIEDCIAEAHAQAKAKANKQ